MTDKEPIYRTIALLNAVDSELGKLGAHGQRMSTGPLLTDLLELKRSVVERSQAYGVLDAEDDWSTLKQPASNYDVLVQHRKRTAVNITGPAKEKFEEGYVAQIVFETHHAPSYVMMLDNGCFIRMVAHVEAPSGSTNKPVGTTEEQVMERIREDHTKIYWRHKEDTPFAASDD